MKNTKKIISLLLALSFAVSLCACGESGGISPGGTLQIDDRDNIV